MKYLKQIILSYRLTPTEKVIIFTSLTDTLGFLLDAMDNSRIKFVEFHTKMDTAKRSSVITLFNTSPQIRVIIMKTELAGTSTFCSKKILNNSNFS